MNVALTTSNFYIVTLVLLNEDVYPRSFGYGLDLFVFGIFDVFHIEFNQARFTPKCLA